jgi:hypothetical protein
MFDFHMGMDPLSLAEIVRMQGFSALLDPEVTAGLAESGALLVSAAVTKTWEVFANPTGRLASTIYFYVMSPTQVALVVASPYGRRREYGFSGMTDALGRFYPYDPAKPYLEPTLTEHEGDVLKIMEARVDTALGRIAVG